MPRLLHCRAIEWRLCAVALVAILGRLFMQRSELSMGLSLH
jgi:hypothetical protein